MSRLLNMMTLDEMSELTGISIQTLNARVKKHGYPCVDGKYRATAELLAPFSNSDNHGLFTLSEIVRRFDIARETLRKRFIQERIEADFHLINGTKLFRMTEQIREISSGERCGIVQHRHSDHLDEFAPEVKNLILQEREKKKWVGKRGILYHADTKDEIIAEGIIEHVSSCGVFVNGVQGTLNQLELAK